ncbi:hypothetical protein ACQEPB_06110 [Novosphingobium fluoreni]|uniref:hypothetical protein n=1 Tax=Novosphingobium fluoreni TaxID=1391222 RepID=UPI003DA04A86
MFEKATVICPTGSDGQFDVGRLLDAMLYYQKIEFVADSRSLRTMYQQFGLDGITSLLTHPSIQAKITPEMPAVHNKTQNGIVAHHPVYISSSGHGAMLFDRKDTASSLAYTLDRENFKDLRPTVNKIIKKVGETRYEKILGKFNSKENYFKELSGDVETLKIFMRCFAARNSANIKESLLSALQVDAYDSSDGLILASNIHPRQIVSSGMEDGWQSILPLVLDYQLELQFAQGRSADIICGDVNSLVSSNRLDLSINRAMRSQEVQTAFEDFAFANARPFGQAYRDGKLGIEDALRTIDRTAKFREWIANVPVDGNLISEFHKAVGKDSLLDKLPSKVARFALFTGAGLLIDAVIAGGLATPLGVGLSLVDSFVLDGLIKGWKPSNFVDVVEEATSHR